LDSIYRKFPYALTPTIMKRFLFSFSVLAIAVSVFAQAPQAFNYQAILRDSDGNPKANETVTLQISIVTDIGTSVYLETHNTKTNELGIVNVVIGEGTGTKELSAVDWSNGPYFLNIKVNGVTMGSSPLLSVPYALYAGTSGTAADAVKITGDQTIAGKKTFTGTIHAGNQRIIHVGTPVGDFNAANKFYVDSVFSSGTHYVGESYGGGIVFYVYDNGRHGLIAATADLGPVVWTTTAFQRTSCNAIRDGVNGGLSNTERIIIQAGAGSYASQLCASNNGSNYADWYLPSKYELNLLYLQKVVVGGFDNSLYWSSTERSYWSVWSQDFRSGIQGERDKCNPDWDYVRPIRAF
jgi:hypothetical protein